MTKPNKLRISVAIEVDGQQVYTALTAATEKQLLDLVLKVDDAVDNVKTKTIIVLQ